MHLIDSLAQEYEECGKNHPVLKQAICILEKQHSDKHLAWFGTSVIRWEKRGCE